MSKFHIVGITGSLRKDSYNKAALREAQQLLPPETELEIVDLSEIPFFNEDLEKDGLPQSVLQLAQKIEQADGLLMATQEYNYSIPPVLKNALDWVSRVQSYPLSGKPTAIFSAAMGAQGGARVQYHLRQVGVILNLKMVNQPEVFIGSAHTKFDEQGRLTDEDTKQHLADLLAALVVLIKESSKK